MAKTKEELINEIMAEALADGEPVTREEAEEMAEMEIGAKEIKNYAQAEPTKKKKVTKERKVDNEKLNLLNMLSSGLTTNHIEVRYENEVKLHFTYNGTEYSVTLTKHRPPK